MIGAGSVQMFPRTEMLELVLVDGHAKGIVVRDMETGHISSHAADAVILATGARDAHRLLDQPDLPRLLAQLAKCGFRQMICCFSANPIRRSPDPTSTANALP